MPRYLLSQHSYACEAGGHGVFLDLKHDKYTAVSPEDLRTLRTAVEGWPASAAPNQTVTLAPGLDAGSAHREATPPQQEDDVIETLLNEGLLTADTSNGKLATAPHLEEPETSFWDFPRPWPQLNARDLRNFVSAWMTTTMRLRALPISHVVNRLRAGSLHNHRQSAPLDIARARQLVTIHFTLQPAFYPSRDTCLRNSLTLLEFLGKYNVYPTCVFGVKMDPFAAHAWVQHGTVVFTDPVEHVRTFTPIMLV